jgi:8-oxo-dGTP diphosphatase
LDAPFHELPAAAAMIPVRPGGEILLMLRDDRPDLPNANRWSTIGGAAEAGETPADAARRESEEEVGRAPGELLPLGTIDGRRFRSHLFATNADWTLDELILGEGQMLDWLTPAQVHALPLAMGIGPAIIAFLTSGLYDELAAGQAQSLPIGLPRFPQSLPRELGLRSGQLIAVAGASAALVRRLHEVLDGGRITASPSETERPDVVLWWPRSAPDPAALPAWRGKLAPGGAIWCIPGEGTPPLDQRVHDLLAGARALGLALTGQLILPTGERALRLSIPHPYARD